MEQGAQFLAGDVMATHWDAGESDVAVMATKKKKPAKKTKKAKPKPTKRGPGCGTEAGKRTCASPCCSER
jgi:hypothetical protein